MAKKSLPPGFRFHPTDVELVMYYLKRKVLGKKLHYEAIAEVNVNKFCPWDLPDKSCLRSKDLEWFFFCPRERKYANGGRVKRATENGYWKTTGKDRSVSYDGKIVGSIKTLIFHLGHAPKGERTDWVIHEYRILDEQLAASGVQDSYVLCKLFKKDGLGPKNGAQYGAPFNEADWEDDEDEGIDYDLQFSVNPSDAPSSHLTLPDALSCSVLTSVVDTGIPPVQCTPSTSVDAPVLDQPDDDIALLLASFADEDVLLSNGNETYEKSDDNGMIQSLPYSVEAEIYNRPEDLDHWAKMNGSSTFSLSGMENDTYLLDHMLLEHGIPPFIELDDLAVPLDCTADAEHVPVTNVEVPYSDINPLHGDLGDYSLGMDYNTLSLTQLLTLPEGSNAQWNLE